MKLSHTLVPAPLRAFFEENPRVALAFSGGVDSAFLLWAATACGADIRAYYVNSPFQPAFELADAHRLAEELGADMAVLPLDVLQNETVTANPPDRCYPCKQAIFSAILEAAAADGHSLVADGTNASDDAGDRPGMRALRELSVRSPLREAGLTKNEIRALSKEAGLFTWNKPSYACLATRIPTGRAIDAETLAKIEAAEDALMTMGFTDFRVRVQLFGNAAKLQLPADQLPTAVTRREEIVAALEPHFSDILLDLRPRQGKD